MATANNAGASEEERRSKLKAEGSNPEAPDKHRQKTEDPGGDGAPAWALKLMTKVDNVGDKVDEIKVKVDEAVKTAQEAKDGVKLINVKVGKFEGEIDNMKKNMEEWKAEVNEKINHNEFKEAVEVDGVQKDQEMESKIKEIDKKLAGVSTMGPQEKEVHEGGPWWLAESGDEDEAMEWIDSQLKSYWIGAPYGTYFKGDTFKGMLFCKFDRIATAEKAIKELNKRKPEFKARCEVFKPWFKQDAPAEERAQVSFLLGLRWQLGEWGENKKNFKVDDRTLTMKAKGKEVVRVSIRNGKFNVDWMDQGWTEWRELQDSVELKALIEAATSKIEQASANAGKGKGKGKAGGQ